MMRRIKMVLKKRILSVLGTSMSLVMRAMRIIRVIGLRLKCGQRCSLLNELRINANSWWLNLDSMLYQELGQQHSPALFHPNVWRRSRSNHPRVVAWQNYQMVAG